MRYAFQGELAAEFSEMTWCILFGPQRVGRVGRSASTFVAEKLLVDGFVAPDEKNWCVRFDIPEGTLVTRLVVVYGNPDNMKFAYILHTTNLDDAEGLNSRGVVGTNGDVTLMINRGVIRLWSHELRNRYILQEVF